MKEFPTFRDERGTIVNVLQEPCENVAVIHSCKGSVRSNHWHKQDSHWIYVLSGSVEYSERNLLAPFLPTHKIYQAGERFFTPIRKVHRVTFLEDSIILSMSKKPQTTKHHMEDCIPEQF